MLDIRGEQLEKFQTDLENRFVKKVRDFCKAKLPICCGRMSDEKLTEHIERSIEQARAFGFSWKNNLTTLCVLDLKFQTSVLDDVHVQERLDSGSPDTQFGRLFLEPDSDIWIGFTDNEIREVDDV